MKWNVRQTMPLFKKLWIYHLCLWRKNASHLMCVGFSLAAGKLKGGGNKINVSFSFFRTCHFINAGISDRRKARIVNQCPTLMGKGDFVCWFCGSNQLERGIFAATVLRKSEVKKGASPKLVLTKNRV